MFLYKWGVKNTESRKRVKFQKEIDIKSFKCPYSIEISGEIISEREKNFYCGCQMRVKKNFLTDHTHFTALDIFMYLYFYTREREKKLYSRKITLQEIFRLFEYQKHCYLINNKFLIFKWICFSILSILNKPHYLQFPLQKY